MRLKECMHKTSRWHRPAGRSAGLSEAEFGQSPKVLVRLLAEKIVKKTGRFVWVMNLGRNLKFMAMLLFHLARHRRSAAMYW